MKALRTLLLALLLLALLLSHYNLPAQSAAPQASGQYYQINPIGFVDQYKLQSSSLEVRDNLLFSGYTHFSIADISNPDQIKVLDRLYNLDYIYDMVIDGQYAYTAMQDIGVYNLDILVNTPSEFAPGPFKATALGVSLADGVLYAVDGTSGVHMLDATKPADLTELGLIKIARAVGVTAVGKTVFVACGYNGVRIFDATNPQSPQELDSVDTPGFATTITVENGVAYVADGQAGVRILDVKDPKNVQEIGFYDTSGTATRTVARGTILYIADGESGLTILSVENPAAPFRYASYRTTGSAVDLAVKDNYIFLSNMPNGVLALSWVPPTVTAGLDKGGALGSDTDQVSYTFPAGAVGSSTQVAHQPLHVNALPDFDDFHVKVGPFFGLYRSPTDGGEAALAAPVKVTLAYNTAAVSPRLEPALRLYALKDFGWVPILDSKVDTQTKTITGTINAFGVYGVFRDRTGVIKQGPK